mgnify:CR=1 FL=1
MSTSFFGTDGIRGQTSLDEVDEEEAIHRLLEQRTLTPAFMRILGEALSHTSELPPGVSARVVIGWDVRPHNEALVAALTLGLRLTGSEVVHIGQCATPSLHAAVFAFEATMGCMITASHNPVSDSGIKVFDAAGYKSTRDFEQEVSRTLLALSQEDREVDQIDREMLAAADERHDEWALQAHQDWLAERWKMFEHHFGGFAESMRQGQFAQPFILDCAGGFGASWLADFLAARGLLCTEVSGSAPALNDGCGAGDFSPTGTWTHEEAKNARHALLNLLPKGRPGQWVGAALDGDGDRCLLIEATERGYRVVDGDGFAARLMEAGRSSGPWTFAASIESDVALSSYVHSMHEDNSVIETAVGDRWLSFALRAKQGHHFDSEDMPTVLGIEDSGHVVLPAPHPLGKGGWSLVGDGAATLCAVILSTDRTRAHHFERGWKQRVSIQDSHRERWHRDADVFKEISRTLCQRFADLGFDATERRIEGEDNLLLIHGESSAGVVSFGIRNSGTQAKTSLSLRLSPGIESAPFASLLEETKGTLANALQ